jgi:acyl-CoA thioester hydrolase
MKKKTMARYKIQLPKHVVFTCEIPVQIFHINYGNHLGHDSLVSIIHEARIKFLRIYNYIETDIEGVGFVVSQLIVDYKKESFYGDILELKIMIEKENKRSCTIYYDITAKENNNTIAHAQTLVTFFDFDLRKSVSIPKAFEDRCISL